MPRRISIRVAMVGQTLESTLLGALDALRSAGMLFESAAQIIEGEQPIEAVIVLARDEDRLQAVQVLAAVGIKAE
jgi:hypothetical protein